MTEGGLNGECDAEPLFNFFGRNHIDRVPWTAVQECSIRSLGCAELAADAKLRVDGDAAERRMLLVRHPVHTFADWAVTYAHR